MSSRLSYYYNRIYNSITCSAKPIGKPGIPPVLLALIIIRPIIIYQHHNRQPTNYIPASQKTPPSFIGNSAYFHPIICSSFSFCWPPPSSLRLFCLSVFGLRGASWACFGVFGWVKLKDEIGNWPFSLSEVWCFLIDINHGLSWPFIIFWWGPSVPLVPLTD